MSSMVAPEPKEVRSENYQPITDPENVKRFIADYFADIPELQKIAGCESHFRHYTAKGNVQRGEKNRYDVGVMQINELYHLDEANKLGLNIHSIDGNVAFARHLYKREGFRPWNSSSKCWNTDLAVAKSAKAGRN